MIIIVAVFLSKNIHARNNFIQNPENQGLTLLGKGEELYNQNQLDSAIIYLKKAAPYFLVAEEWSKLEKTYKLISYSYEDKEEWNNSLQWIKIAQTISDKSPGKIHNNYCSIGYSFQQLGSYDSAEYYFTKCLEYRKKYKLHKKVLEAYGNLQYLYNIRNQFANEYAVINKKEKYSRENLGAYELSNALYTKAHFLSFLNDSSSITAYQQALLLSEQSHNYEAKTGILVGLGDIFMKQGDYDKALEYYNESNSISYSHNLMRAVGYAESSISECYLAKNEYKKAQEHISKAFEANKINKYDHQTPYLYLTQSRVFQKLNSPSKALASTEKGIELAKKKGNTQLLVDLKSLQIELYLELKNYKEANSSLIELQSITKNSNNDTYKAKFYEVAAKVYYSNGDFKKSSDALSILRELEHTISIDQLELKAQKLSAFYELEKRESENKLLKSKSADQEKVIRTQEVSIFLGLIILVLLIIQAITLYRKKEKEKKYAKELEVLFNEIKLLNSNKDSLFSIIAHDLRGPVGNVSAFMDILKDSAQKGDMQTILQASDLLQKQSNLTFETLNNLLQWANSQRDAVSVNLHSNKLKPIVDKVIDLLSLRAKEKDITLINDIPENCTALFDSDMIAVVIRNLGTNAIKFTNSGGSVTFKVSEEEYVWKISVIDTGVGMSKDQLLTLFDQSNYSSKPGTNMEKGSGIGLKLCKDFVERNNGEITVESKLNVGSTFSFTIGKTDSYIA